MFIPKSFASFSIKLGLEADKEGDVFDLGPEGSVVVYGGWFYLSGELVEAGERMSDRRPGLRYFFRASHPPKTMPDFAEEVLALEFSTKLPWVISDPPDWYTARSE